ncbi:hypothetical protein ACFYT3_08590 [Nocardia amikacinitolerans]|uniref:hypothetical protein n=1 Tax=Nocardia amikacinitolerans TaxID=756689 RepID=UPI0036C793C5
MAAKSTIKTGPSPDDPHDLVYFCQPSDGRMPGREYIRSLPTGVRAKVMSVLVEVAAAPPKRFAGGGYWEAMHGEMTGWYEVRCDLGKTHYRVFCRLDYEAKNRSKPLLVIFDGRSKPRRTVLSTSDYEEIRQLGKEYFAANPRPIG